MIKIEAIVREEKLEDVKEALSEIDVHGITIYQVMGCGNKKDILKLFEDKKLKLICFLKLNLKLL